MKIIKERYRPLRISGFRSKWFVTVSGKIMRRLHSGEWIELKKRRRDRNSTSLSVKIKLEDGTFPWFSAADLIGMTFYFSFEGRISLEEFRQLKEMVTAVHINSRINDYHSKNIQMKWKNRDISLYDILDDTEYSWWFNKLRIIERDEWEKFNDRVMVHLLKCLPVLLRAEQRKRFFARKFDVEKPIIERVLKNLQSKT